MTELHFYIAGSSGEPSDDNPITVVQKDETMPLIAKLVPKPLSSDDLPANMRNLVPHLLRIGVLNEEDGLISLGFPLLTLDDFKMMEDSLEKTAQTIVKSLKEDWSLILEIVKTIGETSHTPIEEKVYNILGCIILDWFSLGWLSEEKLIFYKKEQPNGTKYLVQGTTKEAFKKSFSRFCFSTTGGTERWRFTVFGQANDKRWITPELQMRQSIAIRKHLFAPEPLPAVTASFSQIANLHLIARIVDVLVKGDANRTAIENSLYLDANASRSIERYLVEARIIELTKGSQWVPRSMILRIDDKEPLKELSRLARGKIVESVANEFENLNKEYAGTTSDKHGVPFLETMTDLWHDIFSRTIKTFLDEKLMKTMYTEGKTSFSSFIWENDAIDFNL